MGFGVGCTEGLGVVLTGAVTDFAVETFRSADGVTFGATFVAGASFFGVDLENPVGLGKKGEEERLVDVDFAGDNGPIDFF
jgi:hypothetical protein